MTNPERRSDHGHSAIHMQRLPGHIACRIAGQIGDCSGDITALPQAAGRDLAKKRVSSAFRAMHLSSAIR